MVHQQQSRNLFGRTRVRQRTKAASQKVERSSTRELISMLRAAFPSLVPTLLFSLSPMTHIMRMRMEYAARLLRSSDWSIQHRR